MEQRPTLVYSNHATLANDTKSITPIPLGYQPNAFYL